MKIEDDYTDEEYLQLLLATYKDQMNYDPELTKDLIRDDIRSFAAVEKYEVCARLKKILEQLE